MTDLVCFSRPKSSKVRNGRTVRLRITSGLLCLLQAKLERVEYCEVSAKCPLLCRPSGISGLLGRRVLVASGCRGLVKGMTLRVMSTNLYESEAPNGGLFDKVLCWSLGCIQVARLWRTMFGFKGGHLRLIQFAHDEGMVQHRVEVQWSNGLGVHTPQKLQRNEELRRLEVLIYSEWAKDIQSSQFDYIKILSDGYCSLFCFWM